jgi:hypothetical protein
LLILDIKNAQNEWIQVIENWRKEIEGSDLLSNSPSAKWRITMSSERRFSKRRYKIFFSKSDST